MAGTQADGARCAGQRQDGGAPSARGRPDRYRRPLPGAGVASRSTFRRPCVAESVGPARAWLREILAGWTDDAEAVDSAALCLSELVSNAVNHSRSDDVAVHVLLFEGSDERLLLEVHDEGHAADPTVRPLSAASTGGRGLHIVAALCDDWGTRPTVGGTCVWCVISPPRSDGSSGPSGPRSDPPSGSG